MTQEEKQLLLKDLCVRLPYKTKVRKHCLYRETDGSVKEKESDGVLEINDFYYAIWENKPYLRPMSSMTEEEQEEYNKWHEELEEGRVKDWKYAEYNDWLNAHHFDYRELIPMGLALEAPEGMYKNE